MLTFYKDWSYQKNDLNYLDATGTMELLGLNGYGPKNDKGSRYFSLVSNNF